MWSQKDEKEFWLNWLKVYRDSKCLWEYETKRKSTRSERQAAYKELAELAKVVNPAADVNFVRGRINAFRTCYRREFKKMEAARQNGIDYKPQLFYFDMMRFVNLEEYSEDTVFESDSQTGVDSDDPVSWTQRKEETAKRLIEKKEAIRKSIPEVKKEMVEKRKKRNVEESMEADIDIGFEKIENFEDSNDLKSVLATYQTPPAEDEYEIFGKRIAAHFRNMQPNQRLIAEKIISDVCIYARMEKLTLDCNVNLVDAPPMRHQGSQEQTDDDNIDYDDPDTYIYNT